MVGPTTRGQGYPSKARLNGPTNSSGPGRGKTAGENGVGLLPDPVSVWACGLFDIPSWSPRPRERVRESLACPTAGPAVQPRHQGNNPV